MVDIFSESQQRIRGRFFSFKQIGDAIQGTYVDRYDDIDSFQNEQTIVVLKDEQGDYHNVGIRKTNGILLKELARAQLGEIVGFRFEEEKPSKMNKNINAKIIRLYNDPSIVDEKWVAENQKRIAAFQSRPLSIPQDAQNEGPGVPSGVTGAPISATPVMSAVPHAAGVPNTPANTLANVSQDGASAKLEAIRNFARTNGLTDESMSQDDQDATIIAYTGLPLKEEHSSQILIKLSGFSK